MKRIKLFLSLLALALAVLCGYTPAQTTTYTGTIKDLSLNVVTAGQVTFTLAPPTDSTVPGLGRFTPSTINCTINLNGTLSGYVAGVVSGACIVTSNTALSPTGTSYKICIQPNFSTPGSCFFDYAITATKDITTIVPTLGTGPINYGGAPGPPLVFLGIWSSGTTYQLGQTVSYSNLVYISLTNGNLNNNPASSTSNWSVVQSPASVTAAPSVTQSIVQPSGTTLKVNSLNQVLYVDPDSGTDLITQVNALFTACNFYCDVHIPAKATCYVVASGTILIHHATQTLSGDGRDKVRICYAGTAFLDWRMNSSTYDFNTGGDVSGFTVYLSNLAGVALSWGSVLGPKLHDANIYGPGGIANQTPPVGTSQAVVFQNDYNWMERWSIVNVNFGGFAKTLHFMAPTGAGTDSYGYGLVHGVWTSQGAGTYGVVVDAGANVYNQLGFDYQFNSGATTTADEVFRIAGAFTGVNFAVTGENAGAPYTFAHILNGGFMKWHGDYSVFGSPLIIVDTPQPTHGPIPFQILTTAGSLGRSAGIPLLANYDGSGENFIVSPADIFTNDSDQFGARFGYLTSATTNKNAIYDASNANSLRCMFNRNSFGTEASLAKRWCVDGSGNSTQSGSMTAGSSIVAGGSTAGYFYGGDTAITLAGNLGTTAVCQTTFTCSKSSGTLLITTTTSITGNNIIVSVGFTNVLTKVPSCLLGAGNLATAATTFFPQPSGGFGAGFQIVTAGALASSTPYVFTYHCE
jgi:hypothetical protein